jgi:hypothetical protein
MIHSKNKNTKMKLLFLLAGAILLAQCISEDKKVDQVEKLIEMSNKVDGPYIHYTGDKIRHHSTDPLGNVVTREIDEEDTILVTAPYQNPEKFSFNLHSNFPVTPVVTEAPKTILATSDIEGNYFAYVELLKGNGVVDEQLNWSFEDNHLVIVGDLVDRGDYVTQVLWLTYKLDKQAEAVGGKVHVILGNHDLMCMSGDDRYADEKYLNMAKNLNLEYKELYGTNFEIGRWLRTKNAIEKVGDHLFVHGGISPSILELKLSLQDMNDLIKPYYGQKIDDRVPKPAYSLFKTAGLFWYRGYVKGKEGVYSKASQEEVDAILDFYKASSIVVGHCVMDDIQTDYKGRVITIDVEHPEDHSSDLPFQALLIEDNRYYRVNQRGKRQLLD